MEKIFVVIVPVEYHNSRKVCEQMENFEFDSLESLGKHIKSAGLDGSSGDILVYTLSDFMDGVNNQELDVLTDTFISYVRVGK